MSIRYINNFDSALYRFGSPVQQPITPTLIGLKPAYDMPTVFYVDTGLGIAEATWGLMQLGDSTQPPTATISVQPSAYAVLDGHVVPSNGTTIAIQDDGIPLAANGGPVQSKTISLKPHEGPLMAFANSFSATLDFDCPQATGSTDPKDVWAVALRFKDGGVGDDPSNDKSLGVTCQFFYPGNIRFHGTDFDKTHVDNGSYEDYSLYPATQFSMRIELDVSGGNVVAGTGTLEFGSVAHSGQLL